MSELLLALIIIGAPACALSRKPRLDKSMESQGSFSGIDRPGYRIVNSQEQWTSLWRELHKPAPSGADFNKFFAVAAFAGTRESGGFGVVFDEPVVENGILVIRYLVTRPRGMAIMALTQPFAYKFFPKTSKPLRVEGRDE